MHTPERSLGTELENLHIVAGTDVSYEAPLRAHVADFRERITKLVVALRRVGGIDEEAIVAPVTFRARIQDLRDNRSTPLPAPPAIDGVTYAK